MNKKQKIAMAVVSTVMAGAMLVPLAACGGGAPKGFPSRGARSSTVSATVYNGSGTADAKGVMVNSSGKPVYPETTTLNMNICDSGNNDRHITFHESQISGTAVLPDGYSYRRNALKPAWWQISQTLGIKFNDTATNKSSDGQITELMNEQTLQTHNIITGSGSAITNNSAEFLNLADYLDYMPNYKAFLDENPIVKWSLSSGMDATTDTVTGAMYYAPYFDGNNDIEKYVLTHREWTRAMLDAADVSAATTTWAQSKEGKTDTGTNQTYVTPFMGTTGSYTVDTTDPANDTQLVKVKVDYDAAKTAADTADTPLNTAIKAAYSGFTAATSGNIIDIQNDVITGTSGAVTGAQLLNILRAYIDVAYTNEAGEKFYTTRSDVFNSVSAAWDADLYAALSRCVVTSYKLFGGKLADGTASAKQVYALAGRQGQSQRRLDLVAFTGELYGIRGLESRNEFLYIDKDGNLQDARTKTATYDALAKLNAFAKEGLLYTGDENASKYCSGTSSIVTFSMHDYAQTQTTDGFFAQGIEGLTNANIISEGDLKFDFAPILTPVSNWDTDGDSSADTAMRFTESWRATKNTGFAVPKDTKNDPAKLAATLTFIDYLFSNDGQIVATYGPQSTVGNVVTQHKVGDKVNDVELTDEELLAETPNGFWYGNKVTNVDIDTVAEKYKGSDQYHVKKAYAGQYFVFNNEIYTGTLFGTKQIPTLTTHNLNYYLGLKVNGYYLGEGAADKEGVGYMGSVARNYTNYDRGIIGGALPLGNKDQGFEFQGTAACALDGTNVVTKARDNGAIKHLTQEVNTSSYWYTCVPTTLPINTTDGGTLNAQLYLTGNKTNAGLFRNSSETNYRTNLLIDVLFYGYGASKNIAGNADFGTSIPANAAACIAQAKGTKGAASDTDMLNDRVEVYEKGWNALKAYFLK